MPPARHTFSRIRCLERLRATDEDVVDGDVD